MSAAYSTTSTGARVKRSARPVSRCPRCGLWRVSSGGAFDRHEAICLETARRKAARDPEHHVKAP